MIEEAAGTMLYESKKQQVQNTLPATATPTVTASSGGGGGNEVALFRSWQAPAGNNSSFISK